MLTNLLKVIGKYGFEFHKIHSVKAKKTKFFNIVNNLKKSTTLAGIVNNQTGYVIKLPLVINRKLTLPYFLGYKAHIFKKKKCLLDLNLLETRGASY